VHFRFKVIKLMLTNDEQKAQLKRASVYIEIIHTETPPYALEGPSNRKTTKSKEKVQKTYTCLAQELSSCWRYIPLVGENLNFSQVKDDRVTNRHPPLSTVHMLIKLHYTIYRAKLKLKMSASMPRLLGWPVKVIAEGGGGELTINSQITVRVENRVSSRWLMVIGLEFWSEKNSFQR